MGALANVTQDGFGPAAFHAYPSTLRIDGYSGDYGPGFFGQAINAATYVTRDPELGWLAFGGNLTEQGERVTIEPLDASRSRLYLAPAGLWLTLDAGTFQSVTLDGGSVRLRLAAATRQTPVARLRIEQPGSPAGATGYAPIGQYQLERGAYVVALGAESREVVLEARR